MQPKMRRVHTTSGRGRVSLFFNGPGTRKVQSLNLTVQNMSVYMYI